MLTVEIEEREAIDKIIAQSQVCYLGLIDTDGMPYVIPMNFGYDDDILYLHSGPEGGSLEALRANPNVCITMCTKTDLIYQNEEVACSYRMSGASVICRGKVVFEQDYDEKVKALHIIMKHYTDRAFTYSKPAVDNVLIWRVEIEKISTKVYGVPHRNSHKHGDSPYY